ncbi:MAG: hypothetical protein HC936_14065 [Leptolyngbyaceae cyanobacterium SU_3_3]|nr:hypothetical protein [Leptolyngbyaceae cyanobacterium SU_3_3]
MVDEWAEVAAEETNWEDSDHDLLVESEIDEVANPGEISLAPEASGELTLDNLDNSAESVESDLPEESESVAEMNLDDLGEPNLIDADAADSLDALADDGLNGLDDLEGLDHDFDLLSLESNGESLDDLISDPVGELDGLDGLDSDHDLDLLSLESDSESLDDLMKEPLGGLDDLESSLDSASSSLDLDSLLDNESSAKSPAESPSLALRLFLDHNLR